MTEYGRGDGSEPWYPDDPLHGDQSWSGGYENGAGGQSPQHGSWEEQYGGQPPQEHQPQHQEPYYPGQYPDQGAGWDTTGQYYTGEAHPQQPGGGYDTGGYQEPYGGQEAYPAPGQYPQAHPERQHQAQQQYPQHDPHLMQQQYPHQAQQHDPQYAPQQASHQEPRQQEFQQQQDFQQHEEPQQQGFPQQQEPPLARHRDTGPTPDRDPDTGWDPGPDQGESDFFSRDGEEDDGRGDEPAGRRGERSKKRRRGGCGCMVAAVIVAGGLGGVAYYGYQFYQDRFGPAPDFTGEGTGTVQVEIPAGSSTSAIGNILKESGVVRSHDAFVEAAGDQSFQAGVFQLREEMSADSAVELLLDPAAISALIIPEGRRATEIYGLIDEYLDLEEGATEEAAESADLGLPEWAEGDPEGFLFPARYDVGQDASPEELLQQMVDRAEAEFAEVDLEGQAAEIDRTPREVLTIASLIEAEGQSDEEFVNVSRVIHNRLDIDMRLQFDSTINYAMGRSTLDTSEADTQFPSPYNTYIEYGLPPGPIDNPGHEAIEAALNPADGPWLYFVTVTEGDTRFTDDYAEHERNVEDFNAAQNGDG
jgi:UPF0755 protein